MIIAHLPAGYVAAKLLYARVAAPRRTSYRAFIAAGLLGAIAPDFDLVYFYLHHDYQTLHHTLWPHYPVLWLGVLLLGILWMTTGPARRLAPLLFIFGLNGLVHMVLDTIVGKIWWLAPFDMNFSWSLVTIPRRLHPWWLNHVFHWTFLLELAIIGWAVYLWLRMPPPAPANKE